MNAMSISPVKPTLNSGNHTVSPTATNLSKTALPSSNSFTPLNLVTENKPVTAVNTSGPEKSLDLCSKQPTSNGTVSPVSESNASVCAINSQNCSTNCEAGETLTANSSSLKNIEISVDVKNSNAADEKKIEEKAENLKINDKPDSVKENAGQVDLSNETAKVVESSSVNKEDNKESTVDSTVSPPTNVHINPVKSEPVPEKSKVEHVSEKKCVLQVKETEKGKKDSSEETNVPKTTKRKAKQTVEVVEEESGEGRKSKRIRLPTQPYQSSIPELQLIAKLTTPSKATPKTQTEKIIAFYKNEFLAVRNPEGSFYICQTFQNIHRSSTKIKIRWFTNLPQDIFTPDFYDTTEFDCILTNVKMVRMEKDRWKLPDQERTRIENILKRALDVEKGVVDKPSITEEHPDGLDLSLYKDEAQLTKKKKKKKSLSPKSKQSNEENSKNQKTKDTTKVEKTVSTSPTAVKKSQRLSYLNHSETKETSEKSKHISTEKTQKDKKSKKKNKLKNHNKNSLNSPKQSEKSSTKAWEPSIKSSNSSRVILSLRKEDTSTKVSSTSVTEKKTFKRTTSVSAKAGTHVLVVPTSNKKKKEEPKSVAAERPGKVRNAGSAVTAKINSAAMRTTKDKERKTSNSSNQRKK